MKNQVNLNEMQITYLEAKAAYEATDFSDDSKLTLLEIRQAAEMILLNWAHEQVGVLPQYKAVRAEIENLYEKAHRFPSIYKQLIDLSLRLEA